MSQNTSSPKSFHTTKVGDVIRVCYSVTLAVPPFACLGTLTHVVEQVRKRFVGVRPKEGDVAVRPKEGDVAVRWVRSWVIVHRTSEELSAAFANYQKHRING